MFNSYKIYIPLKFHSNLIDNLGNKEKKIIKYLKQFRFLLYRYIILIGR